MFIQTYLCSWIQNAWIQTSHRIHAQLDADGRWVWQLALLHTVVVWRSVCTMQVGYPGISFHWTSPISCWVSLKYIRSTNYTTWLLGSVLSLHMKDITVHTHQNSYLKSRLVLQRAVSVAMASCALSFQSHTAVIVICI